MSGMLINLVISLLSGAGGARSVRAAAAHGAAGDRIWRPLIIAGGRACCAVIRARAHSSTSARTRARASLRRQHGVEAAHGGDAEAYIVAAEAPCVRMQRGAAL